jgi:hypothetical protein
MQKSLLRPRDFTSVCRTSACAYHVRPHVIIQYPQVLVACPHVRIAHGLRLAETDKMCVCMFAWCETSGYKCERL